MSFTPFFFGRWNDATRAHVTLHDEQMNEKAAELYGEDAYDPPATRAALARFASPAFVFADELDGGPRPEPARHSAEVFPNAELTVQPGAGHY
ncbi:hypothetical protein ABT269_21705 [Streptomyces viridosporus]|uniref:alpha/beta fold hydrolase n=1 Tax=Streptomyces viridosporus TaxID=67581 RepID=UPI003326E304